MIAAVRDRAEASPAIAIVPIKPFAKAKTRLAGAIGPAQRAEIARRLARGVLAALREANVPILVVTADPDARILAAENGAAVLDEEWGHGLNAAFSLGLESAEARGAMAALLIHADLPHIDAADLRLAIARPGLDGVTIAPSTGDEGTNAMCVPLPSPISPAYGPGSFKRHCAAALAAGAGVKVLRRPGLAVDVDRPGDLSA